MPRDNLSDKAFIIYAYRYNKSKQLSELPGKIVVQFKVSKPVTKKN